jgi:ankyrin repeat protein
MTTDRINCLRLLLDHGADIYQVNNEGNSILDIADDNLKQIIEAYLEPIKEPEFF